MVVYLEMVSGQEFYYQALSVHQKRFYSVVGSKVKIYWSHDQRTVSLQVEVASPVTTIS